MTTSTSSSSMAEVAVEDAPFVGMLVDFGRVLRDGGIPVGSSDVLTCCAAMEPLDPTDITDLYWGGRTTLVTRREQIPTYDRLFRHFFLGDGVDEDDPARRTIRAKALSQAPVEIPDPGPDAEQRAEEEARLGLLASDAARAFSRSARTTTRPSSRMSLGTILDLCESFVTPG